MKRNTFKNPSELHINLSLYSYIACTYYNNIVLDLK